MQKQSCSLLVLTLGALLCLPATLTHAQWTADPPPADSPYWWTLSDQITREELRAALQSREKNRARLRDAIALGVYPQIEETRIQEISVYIDGTLHPELFPLYDVFAAFAVGCHPGEAATSWEEEARRGMARHGMSDEGIDYVVTAACNHIVKTVSLGKALGADQRSFAEKVLAPLEARIGKKEARKAIDRQDFDLLSQHSGLAQRQIADLHQAWRRDPIAEIGTASLVHLRASMDDEDWEALRQFFLSDLVPRMNLAYFAEGAFH